MANLSALRRELRPVYGEHADAVISLIGLEPNSTVLRLAKEKRLGDAHAVQVADYRRVHTDMEPFTGWKEGSDQLPETPDWFSTSIPKVPSKLPDLEIRGGAGGFSLLANIPHQHIVGNVFSSVVDIGRKKALVVRVLQSHTKGLPTKVTNKYVEWRHLAMKKVEEIARKNDCSVVLFSAGVQHSERNVEDRPPYEPKPTHLETLRTYGKLPLQHGYVLSELRDHIPGNYEPEKLWWVKKLK